MNKLDPPNLRACCKCETGQIPKLENCVKKFRWDEKGYMLHHRERGYFYSYYYSLKIIRSNDSLIRCFHKQTTLWNIFMFLTYSRFRKINRQIFLPFLFISISSIFPISISSIFLSLFPPSFLLYFLHLSSLLSLSLSLLTLSYIYPPSLPFASLLPSLSLFVLNFSITIYCQTVTVT